MPRGDGTGPRGQGTGTGRGMRGRSMDAGRATGSAVPRMGGNRAGAGPGGQCVCPSCGTKVAHRIGVPCYQARCPECGSSMVRG